MPLPPPANYSIGELPDPAAAARGNLEFATGLIGAQQGMVQAQQKSQLFDMQVQEVQRQQAQRDLLQENLAALGQNPRPENIARIMVMHPEVADKFKPGFDALTANEQKARLSQAMQIQHALYAGQPEAALKKIEEEWAPAYDNSGDAKTAAELRGVANVIKQNPKNAAASLGLFLASAQGPEKFMDTFKGFTLLPGEQRLGEANATTAESTAVNSAKNQAGIADKSAADAKTAVVTADNAPAKAKAEIGNLNASADSSRASAANSRSEVEVRNKTLKGLLDKNDLELKNIKSQIDERGATADLAGKKAELERQQAALVRAKTTAETDEIRSRITDLPADIRKEVNGHVDAAEKSRTEADDAASLAADLEKINGFGSSGAPAKIAESVKAALGGENGVTQTRQRYQRFQTSQTFEQLHGLGRITEKEVDLVHKGMPDPVANPKLAAEYVRTVEKGLRIAAEMESAKAAFKSANRSSLAEPAKISFTIGSRQVHPGDTFEKFLKRTPADDARVAELRKKAGL